jgi:D-alanine-D-alanine ligase
MRIGMTYDLRTDYLEQGYAEEDTAEFDRPDTISAIEGALRDLGHQPDRIGNVRSLTQRLVSGDRWDLVFNIAEGLRGFGREAQVPALLEAYEVPYTFSDALVLALTLHKGVAKHVVRDLGIPTPDFAVVESEQDLAGIGLPFPLFAKPVAEGTGKGIDASSRITSRRGLEDTCRRLLATYRQPVLVETYLPGREFTVGILGTGREARSLGIMEVVLKQQADPHVYSYRNKEYCEELVEYRTPTGEVAQRTQQVALASWKALGCRDAGRVDLRLDAAGVPNFMEVNPLAGLHPEHSDLCIIASRFGIAYRDLIASILLETLARIRRDGR